jgi:hypothetical protein
VRGHRRPSAITGSAITLERRRRLRRRLVAAASMDSRRANRCAKDATGRGGARPRPALAQHYLHLNKPTRRSPPPPARGDAPGHAQWRDAAATGRGRYRRTAVARAREILTEAPKSFGIEAACPRGPAVPSTTTSTAQGSVASLSRFPVRFMDAAAGVCVFEFPPLRTTIYGLYRLYGYKHECAHMA